MVKQVIQKSRQSMGLLSLYVFTSIARAALPTPPPDDLPSGGNDVSDTIATIIYKNLGYALVILGVIVVMGGAYGIFHAYQVGREKQDLGHTFKHGGVCAVVIVIGLALLYYANSMLPT